jgi:phospholipase D1/2
MSLSVVVLTCTAVDRTKSSRMGWTDISISLIGPVVDSLQLHFADRWNYIFGQKYDAKDGEKYSLLEYTPHHTEQHHGGGMFGGAFGGEHHHTSKMFGDLGERFNRHVSHFFDQGGDGERVEGNRGGSCSIQITRR